MKKRQDWIVAFFQRVRALSEKSDLFIQNWSYDGWDKWRNQVIKYFITCWPDALVWRVTGALLPMPNGHPISSHDLSSESGQMKGLLGIRRTNQASNSRKRSGNTNLP